jgi:tryptophanyl-tRNA synthetase
MYTDPTRIHATDPGKVEGNPVFDYHDAFNPNKEEVTDLKERYVQGKVGDVEVKDKLFIAMETLIAPMRERYITYAQKPDFVYELLHEGTKKVRRMAESTLDEVKEAMYLPKF